MKNIVILFLSILLLGNLNAQDFNKTHNEVDKLFRNELKKENVRNAFLAIYSPSLQFDWEFAGGFFKSGEPITTLNAFYSASIGKTFTATAIAILMEQKQLDYEDKISMYLPRKVIENLHVFEGKDYSTEITIAQLLQHTSGLPDYFEGETVDGSPNVIQSIFIDTSKFWNPVEIISFSKEKMKPNFLPGAGYMYTDTEYVLLGMIIEHISGMALPDFFQKYLFEPLEMYNSWINLRSKPLIITGKMAGFYAGDFEGSTMTSLSADWAGGALVTTSADLITFQFALNTGEIISKNTLETMQKWIPETMGMYYGFGLRKVVFNELSPMLPDLYMVGHSGSTGSFMYYCPQLDVYIAGTLNQTDAVQDAVVLTASILSLISENIHN
jgi:D-alanyl-D-alanine carboxypeptidase